MNYSFYIHVLTSDVVSLLLYFKIVRAQLHGQWRGQRREYPVPFEDLLKSLDMGEKKKRKRVNKSLSAHHMVMHYM